MKRSSRLLTACAAFAALIAAGSLTASKAEAHRFWRPWFVHPVFYPRPVFFRPYYVPPPPPPPVYVVPRVAYVPPPPVAYDYGYYQHRRHRVVHRHRHRVSHRRPACTCPAQPAPKGS